MSEIVNPKVSVRSLLERPTLSRFVGELSSKARIKWLVRGLFGGGRTEVLGEEVTGVERDRFLLWLGRSFEMGMTFHDATSETTGFDITTIAHGEMMDKGQRTLRSIGRWPCRSGTRARAESIDLIYECL